MSVAEIKASVKELSLAEVTELASFFLEIDNATWAQKECSIPICTATNLNRGAANSRKWIWAPLENEFHGIIPRRLKTSMAA